MILLPNRTGIVIPRLQYTSPEFYFERIQKLCGEYPDEIVIMHPTVRGIRSMEEPTPAGTATFKGQGWTYAGNSYHRFVNSIYTSSQTYRTLFSVAHWNAGAHSILSTGDKDVATANGLRLEVDATGAALARTFSSTSTQTSATTTVKARAGMLNSFGAFFSGSAIRYSMVNGILSAINTTTRSPTYSAMDSLTVGNNAGTTLDANPFNGEIVFNAFWGQRTQTTAVQLKVLEILGASWPQIFERGTRSKFFLMTSTPPPVSSKVLNNLWMYYQRMHNH